jgi:hypothetical protein
VQRSESEATSGVCPLIGEAAAPPRLRWSPWPSEVGWTAPLRRWVGMVTASVMVSILEVAMCRRCRHLHRIRSFRALPRLDGTILRCRRRVRGGGSGPAGSCTGVRAGASSSFR